MRMSKTTQFAAMTLAALLAATLISSQSLTAPVPALATLEMRDLTTEDIRNAVAGGITTVVVPTGGIEQNGPHMVLGKHDYIVGHAARNIAAELGYTLVAPVVSYVPEGDYEPATGNMRLPGTIGVPEPVFDGLLEGIARSLKAGGFKLICFIGDHGQSQDAQKAVAERLTKAWAASGVRVAHIDAYYDDTAQNHRLLADGETAKTIGAHAGIIDTSELLAVHPAGVDLARDRSGGLKVPGFTRETGASGAPSLASAERGRWLIEMRIKAAVAQIRALMLARS